MKKISALWIGLFLVFNYGILLPTHDARGGSPPPPDDGIDGLQYINGDWNVNTAESYTNETIVLTGNLTVESGGQLTFNNVTLKLNCSANGTYHINVTSGGSFYIYDLDNDNTTTWDASVITSNYPDGQHRFLFWIMKDANVTMKSSELHECGYNGVTLDELGIYIQSDNAIIERSLVSNNYYGIVVNHSSPIIYNNTITRNGVFGLYAYNSTSRIENNTISSNGDRGIWAEQSTLIFRYNIIRNNSGSGVYLREDDSSLIENNIVENHPNNVGIYLQINSNSYVANNTIVNSYDGINAEFSSDATIINNTIIDSDEDGIFIVGSNPIIIDTHIQNAGFGIVVTGNCVFSMTNSSISGVITSSDFSIFGTTSVVTVLNTTFNHSNVIINTDTAKLVVQYFLHSYVNDTFNNSIPEATVRVRNNLNGTFDENYTTDTDGWARWIVLTERIQNISTNISYTPHNITAEYNSVTNSTEVTMDVSKEVIIKLDIEVDPWVLPLSDGWNLISLPLEQSNESINQVLSSIIGKWDIIQIYDPLSAEPWKTNCTFKPDSLNDFDTLNHKMAFWINITEPGGTILTVSGPISDSTSIPLYAGWNLVGYPTQTTETIANALWGTGADKVEKFDAPAPYRISEVGPTYVMKPGEGYWIHVPADTVWIINW